MPDIDKLIAELESETKRLVRFNDEREIKAQRATLPRGDYGLPVPGNKRTLDLTDADKAFLYYVRKGETKALALDDTGQYLVSPAIEAEIERSLAKDVTIRPLASYRRIDKDRVQIRDITEASVSWGRLETGSGIDESELIPGAPRYKYCCDLYGLVKLGEDEMMDSDFDLAVILADSFSRAIAEKENEAFLKGTGWDTGQQPDGITLDATLIENTVTTGAAGVVTVEDFLDLIYACPKRYRKNGSLIVNSATELALRKLRARGGNESNGMEGSFLWQPAVQAGAPNTFLGRPIYADDDMETLSGTAQVIAVFGDFQRGYRIIDRLGIGIQRLSELYSEAGLVGFKVHARVGGYCIRPANKSIVLLTEHA